MCSVTEDLQVGGTDDAGQYVSGPLHYRTLNVTYIRNTVA